MNVRKTLIIALTVLTTVAGGSALIGIRSHDQARTPAPPAPTGTAFVAATPSGLGALASAHGTGEDRDEAWERDDDRRERGDDDGDEHEDD